MDSTTRLGPRFRQGLLRPLQNLTNRQRKESYTVCKVTLLLRCLHWSSIRIVFFHSSKLGEPRTLNGVTIQPTTPAFQPSKPRPGQTRLSVAACFIPRI